eukprot:530546-Alexandrium_andersonii.AAC.1
MPDEWRRMRAQGRQPTVPSTNKSLVFCVGVVVVVGSRCLSPGRPASACQLPPPASESIPGH